MFNTVGCVCRDFVECDDDDDGRYEIAEEWGRCMHIHIYTKLCVYSSSLVVRMFIKTLQ